MYGGGGGGLVAKSCLTRDHMDCSPARFLHPWILQARILEWVAISFSKMFVYRKVMLCMRSFGIVSGTIQYFCYPGRTGFNRVEKHWTRLP